MSSPSASAGPSLPGVRKGRRGRNQLRNGTWILPGTGERIRRQITLRRSPLQNASTDGAADSDTLRSLTRQVSRTLHLQTAYDRAREQAIALWKWFQTPIGQGVLKCSLAYVLGCMGTFFPPLSQFLGQQDGKHMVATVTVYFNPARSAGSMVEAVLCGLAAFAYAAFIAVSSMAVAVLFESQWDLIELAYVLILVIFCAGGLGFVGWVKLKMSNPLVNTACSLASLAIITVVTKENAVHTGVFSDDKIIQVLKMILLGMFFTTSICLFVWPTSARTELREAMIKTTNGFGEMLTLITRTFLSGAESDMESSEFKECQQRYRAVLKTLPKQLREAKFEHYILGTEEEYRIEKELFNCMQRLSQAIGGLRSAATTQFTLLKEIQQAAPDTGAAIPRLLTATSSLRSPPSSEPFSPASRNEDLAGVLSSIDEASDEASDDDIRPPIRSILERQDSELTYPGLTGQTATEIFSRFISEFGPSMKSLAYTLAQILEELPFGLGPEYRIVVNEHFSSSLTAALELYTHARFEALSHLYRSKDLGRDRPETVEADIEEVAASCGHFSYNLQDFGREMQVYLEILEDLKLETEKRHRRSWNWLLFWRQQPKAPQPRDEEEDPLLAASRIEADPVLVTPPLPRETPPQSLQTMATQWLALHWVTFKRFLRRDDIRFATKVGIGAALWAMIAFIPSTRPFYQHWRGEWGLLSYMLVCSMTIGAANTTGLSRFFGTFLGAAVGVIAWEVTRGNGFALIIFGWIFCLPCFYLIVGLGKGPMGRFILLTYNLSVLYAYSLSIREADDDDDEGGDTPYITEIALHRVVAVTFGCLCGVFITRMIWPISARKKLKDGLAILWLRMALMWRRDPLSALLEGNYTSSKSYMNLGEETKLHQYLSRLDSLRQSAMSEMELRGPFPASEYARILDSTGKILDAFHAMNVVIQKDLKASEGEAAILKFTAEERAQLSSRLSHLFQVLASSMKLEYPLNDSLPNTASARDRLLAKIFHFRKQAAISAPGSTSDFAMTPPSEGQQRQRPPVKDEDFALLYAYALVTGQVDAEIKKVDREIENLFGTFSEDALLLK